MRPVLLAAAALSAVAAPVQAQSNAAVQFDLPAQPLATSLAAVAQKTGTNILFRPETVQGLNAGPLVGSHTALTAVNALIAGTPLEAVADGASGIVIRPAVGATTNSQAFGDIVVTARKREERLIEVPIAVTVFGGAAIERRGANNVADFLQEAPGVSIIDNGNGVSQVSIRGISTSLGANENGWYLDDLPFTGVSVPISPDVRGWDLDRVEVLRGPQGTLFGEGSLGGTVRILTARPDMENWLVKGEGVLSMTEGGGLNHGLKGAASVPIIPGMLAVRVSGTTERFEGWINDPATNRNRLNDQSIDTFRASVRFDPTERLSLNGSYWYYDGEFPNGGSSATDEGNISQAVVLSSGSKYELYGASARYAFDRAALFYGYAHSSFDLPQSGSLFGGTLISTIGIEVDSHELRLSSTGDSALKWTIGGYIRESKRSDDFQFALFGLDNQSITKSSARAVFGEATYTLPWAPVDVTAGLRYFEDDLRGVEFNSGIPTVQPGGKYDSLNPRFIVAWRPSDNLNIYTSASKGFRSGQLQPTVSGTLANLIGLDLPAALAEDSLWSYELGAKAILFDGRLSLEAAIYHSEWEDVTVRIPIGTTGFNGLINSEGSRTTGVEGSVVARPVEGLTLTAGASYANARYKGDVPGTGIVDGARVDSVPLFTANAAVDYRRRVDGLAELVGRISWQHNSPRDFSSFEIWEPGDTIDRVDARLGIDFGRFGASLFVENLTNENGAVSARTVQPIAPGVDDITANRLRPRTIGVQARFDFQP